jgi:hypothetical protein
MDAEQVVVVEILPTKVWIESDFFGGKHVMRQHEGHEPFCFCSFWYSYEHTSNAQIHRNAEDMARSLGAQDPIEHRHRPLEISGD